jgi:hypothetical protein
VVLVQVEQLSLVMTAITLSLVLLLQPAAAAVELLQPLLLQETVALGVLVAVLVRKQV